MAPLYACLRSEHKKPVGFEQLRDFFGHLLEYHGIDALTGEYAKVSLPPTKAKKKEQEVAQVREVYHGTYAGFQWHKRYKVYPICQPCRKAQNAYLQARYRAKHGPKRRPAHGTISGVSWHQRRREPPCDLCRQARNEYQRERIRKKRLRDRLAD